MIINLKSPWTVHIFDTGIFIQYFQTPLVWNVWTLQGIYFII